MTTEQAKHKPDVHLNTQENRVAFLLHEINCCIAKLSEETKALIAKYPQNCNLSDPVIFETFKADIEHIKTTKVECLVRANRAQKLIKSLLEAKEADGNRKVKNARLIIDAEDLNGLFHDIDNSFTSPLGFSALLILGKEIPISYADILQMFEQAVDFMDRFNSKTDTLENVVQKFQQVVDMEKKSGLEIEFVIDQKIFNLIKQNKETSFTGARMWRVLRNLFQNARKVYMDKQIPQTIKLRLTIKEGDLVLVYDDEADGFDPDLSEFHEEVLFSPFVGAVKAGRSVVQMHRFNGKTKWENGSEGNGIGMKALVAYFDHLGGYLFAGTRSEGTNMAQGAHLIFALPILNEIGRFEITPPPAQQTLASAAE